MPGRDAKKFDPARAPALDAPERERYLPTVELIDQLRLGGDETVLDYGAGTGRLSRAVAEQLRGDRRRRRRARRVAERILAVNLLREVRGEAALAEIRRLRAGLPFHFAIRASKTDT